MTMNPEPEKKPIFDRTIYIPLLLGVLSLCGILLVFVIGRVNAERPLAPVEDSPTPFKYQLIGTEPGISTSEPLTATEPPVATVPPASENGGTVPTSFSAPPLSLRVTAQQGGVSNSGSSNNGGNNASPTKTKTSSSAIQTVAAGATDPIIIFNPDTKTAEPSSAVIFRTFTPSRTPGPTFTVTPSRTKYLSPTANGSLPSTATNTPTGQVPLVPGTYDDSHPLITYNGWDSITDATAYQSTLHVSDIVGATVSFRFTGQQLRIKFQGSASFGVIRISIGGLNFDLDESNGTDEWVSALLAQGTYTITITHTSGGSVNLDAIIIPDLSTPTATPRTVTP